MIRACLAFCSFLLLLPVRCPNAVIFQLHMLQVIRELARVTSHRVQGEFIFRGGGILGLFICLPLPDDWPHCCDGRFGCCTFGL